MTRVPPLSMVPQASLQQPAWTAVVNPQAHFSIFRPPPVPPLPSAAASTKSGRKTPSNLPTTASLKKEYFRCLGGVAQNIEPLRKIIRRLVDFGVHKQQLLEWAHAAGYSESHLRNIINRLLRESGGRSRRAGAGRKTPDKALKIMAFAVEACGEVEAGKHLLAAHHAWRVRKAVAGSQSQAA